MTTKRGFISIQQKTPTFTGGEMNVVLVPSQWVFTPTEIGKLSLRTPRPVTIYLCDSNNNTRVSDQHHVLPLR